MADHASGDPPVEEPVAEAPPEAIPPELPAPPPDVPFVHAMDEGLPGRSAYGTVLRLRNFRRLWIGMTISSVGDWVGLFALLSITDRLSSGNTLAVAGLMIFRVLPAFIFGPIAGVLLDRVDRRKALVGSRIASACLIAVVPFVLNIPTLYAITFLLEISTLVWLPAKDALIPDLVPRRLLVATNSLSLFTTYGVFPLGALAFTALAGVAAFLGAHVTFLGFLNLNQENLALWIDAALYIASVILVSRLRVPQVRRDPRPVRFGVLREELMEGLHYLRERSEIARVMRSIAIALAGGAVVFSLGAPYSAQVLDGGAQGFGGIVASLGTGMGLGVLVLGFIGDRFPKAWLASLAVIFAGLMLLAAGVTTQLAIALVVAGLFGAGAGIAYASLFALLQEIVHDEVRGRTFSSVQVVIRIALFVSLVVFPALAELYGTALFDGNAAQGIRLALASGGLLTCAAGLHGAWDVYRGRIHSIPA